MSFLIDYIKLTRLNQPTGIWLLFLPSLFGIFLALKKVPAHDFQGISYTIFLFLIGSIVMRSAGCVINDILDKKFDQSVERTKNRPIASGKVSKREAILILSLLLATGLAILLQFNTATILSGTVALVLVATYPIMKRITYYPQLFLGLTFNFGILMSSLAILGKIELETIILYFACIIWTIIYDTVYAFQDIDDDLKIGVKSTAIKFKDNPQKILTSLNFAMFIAMLCLGWLADFRPEYFLTALVVDLLINHKLRKCDFKDPKKCLKFFKSNIWIGVIMLFAIILG